MTDNVTAFPGAGDLPTNLLEVKPDHGYCQHPRILADEHTRTVNCLECGATLDPFNFVRQQAVLISRAWDRHRHVIGEANQIAERVHALKKEEQRLRAMVKRLQEKLPGATIRNREL